LKKGSPEEIPNIENIRVLNTPGDGWQSHFLSAYLLGMGTTFMGTAFMGTTIDTWDTPERANTAMSIFLAISKTRLSSCTSLHPESQLSDAY
jgi:hypothetical protein